MENHTIRTKVRILFFIKLFIIFNIFFINIITIPIYSQSEAESNAQSDNYLFDDDSFWEQTPLVVEEKLDLKYLKNWGLLVIIIYMIGIIFTVFTVHYSGANNLLAPEIIILLYMFWFILLPYTLWLLVKKQKDK